MPAAGVRARRKFTGALAGWPGLGIARSQKRAERVRLAGWATILLLTTSAEILRC